MDDLENQGAPRIAKVYGSCSRLRGDEQHQKAPPPTADGTTTSVLLGTPARPEELTPLLQPARHRDLLSRRGSDISVGSVVGLELDKAELKLSRHVSKFIQRYPDFTDYLQRFFSLVLNNGLLGCLGILVIKGVRDSLFHDLTGGRCSILGNWNLQIADTMLVLSYSCRSFLQLRLCLTLACICFVVYALTSPIGIMMDMLMFNFVMALLNLSHAVTLIYEKRHIDFDANYEQIYINLFASYMARTDFQKLVTHAVVREEKHGVVMKQEGDLVTSLCILVKGNIVVKRDSKVINRLGVNEILEAPEWVRSNLNPETTRFKLSFVSEGNVTYVKWSRETLCEVLKENPKIKSSVLAVLGIKTAELWLRSVRKDSKHSSGHNSEMNSNGCSPYRGGRGNRGRESPLSDTEVQPTGKPDL